MDEVRGDESATRKRIAAFKENGHEIEITFTCNDVKNMFKKYLM